MTEIKVYLTHNLYQKLIALTQECESEIGGILLGDIEDNKILIDDVIIPKQTVSSAHVTMDAKDIADATIPLAKKDPKVISRVKGWWHSHSDFQTFWSAIDETTIKKLTKFMGLCVSINTSQKYPMKVRLDVSKPLYLSMDDLPYQVLFTSSDKIKDWAAKEIKKKIKAQVFQQVNYNQKLPFQSVYWFNTLNEFIRNCSTTWKNMNKKQKKGVKQYYKQQKQQVNRRDPYERDYDPTEEEEDWKEYYV